MANNNQVSEEMAHDMRPTASVMPENSPDFAGEPTAGSPGTGRTSEAPAQEKSPVMAVDSTGRENRGEVTESGAVEEADHWQGYDDEMGVTEPEGRHIESYQHPGDQGVRDFENNQDRLETDYDVNRLITGRSDTSFHRPIR